MSLSDPAASGWHLDKRVPITLILTILIQTGSIGWFLSGLNEKVESGIKDRARLEARVNAIEGDRDDYRDRMTRVEVKIENQTVILSDILKELRRGGN